MIVCVSFSIRINMHLMVTCTIERAVSLVTSREIEDVFALLHSPSEVSIRFLFTCLRNVRLFVIACSSFLPFSSHPYFFSYFQARAGSLSHSDFVSAVLRRCVVHVHHPPPPPQLVSSSSAPAPSSSADSMPLLTVSLLPRFDYVGEIALLKLAQQAAQTERDAAADEEKEEDEDEVCAFRLCLHMLFMLCCGFGFPSIGRGFDGHRLGGR